MKSLTEYIYKSSINEMAIKRGDFELRVWNAESQIIQNWCLVYWCDRYSENSKAINRNHWANELKAHMKNIVNDKIKGGKKNKVIEKVIIDDDELNDSNRIANIIRDKFAEEGLGKYVNIISRDCANHIKEICGILASNNNYAVDEYVNGMIG
jgi:hypothetical protein